MKNVRKLFVIFCSSLILSSCSSVNYSKDDSVESPKMAKMELAESEIDRDAYSESEADALVVMDEAGEVSLEASKNEGGVDAAIELARKLSTSDNFRVKAPEMLARYKDENQDPLPMELTDIHVIIAAHRMRVVQDMVFYNPSDSVLQGSLMVALPQGASPAYLGMFQGKGPDKNAVNALDFSAPQKQPLPLLQKDMEFKSKWYDRNQKLSDWGEFRGAKVTSSSQGQQVYERIAQRRVDPALSLWAGSNKFTTKIYPLNPKQFKRVVFVYDMNLELKGQTMRVNLPLPENSTIPTRIMVSCYEKGFRDVQILAGNDDLKAEKKENLYQWLWLVPKDFQGSLIFTAKLIQKNISTLSGTHVDIPGKLSHILIKPPVEAVETRKKTGRALFLLDTSYSSRDKLYSMSGKILKAILENDKSIDEFAALAFDVNVCELTSGFVTPSSKNKEELYETIEKIWLDGASHFSSVLTYLQENPVYYNADKIFLLSDGQISWGVEKVSQLSKAFIELFNKDWICYQFQDYPSNQALFHSLTQKKGQIITLSAGQDIGSAALAHQREGLVLESVFSDSQAEILIQGDPELIYPGQVLELVMKNSSPVQNDRISLNIQGKIYEYDISFNDESELSSLGARAWAQVYIDRLLALEDREADELVLSLSQSFNVSNRVASFIILETDEEYIEHKIQSVQLDFSSIMEKLKLKARTQAFDLPPYEELSSEAIEVLEIVKNTPAEIPWKLIKTFQSPIKRSLLIQKAYSNDPGENPVDLYLWAREKQISGVAENQTAALRVLSRIIEIKPRDVEALRMVGYVLMEWGLFQDAARLFLRVREIRPFEAQAYLLEALAYTALGDFYKAAYLFEWVLEHDYPRYNDFVKVLASIWYFDLLNIITENINIQNNKNILNVRIDKLWNRELKKGRVVLFWNIDYTDVDLHVKEDTMEVYYSEPESDTGGHLWWDNTLGLGPEIYDHPTLSKRGFEVFVHYFGSQNVEGKVPAATFAAVFTKQQGDVKARFYSTLLIGVQKDKLAVMPLWKR